MNLDSIVYLSLNGEMGFAGSVAEAEESLYYLGGVRVKLTDYIIWRFFCQDISIFRYSSTISVVPTDPVPPVKFLLRR